MSVQTDIAALLGSRICHDLISPIGAISNGVELLRMGGDASGPEIDLISESVENANARIKFFRIAYGAANEGQMLGSGEVVEILGDLSRGGRMRYNWLATSDLPRSEVKLSFLLLQCVEAALPWGGDVTITRVGTVWEVLASAERMRIEDAQWAHAQSKGNAQNLGAADVQFLLLPLLLGAANRRLSVNFAHSTLTARF